MERLVLDAQLVGPLSGGLRLSTNGDESIVAAIVLLLFLGRPTTVLRLIIAAGVNAVNRVLGRRFLSHVGEKVLERIPAGAHGNSFGTILSVGSRVLVGAAASYLRPYAMFGCAGKSVRGVSGDAYGPVNVNIETSA